MKKVIFYAACILLVSSVAAAPDSKLVASFNQMFPNAKNVKWRDDKDGYFVSFTQNEIFDKAFYNKNGDFVYSLKYFNGDELPVNIRMIVNKKFGESSIIGVTEVTTQDNLMYDIKLSKGTKLYCLDILADGTVEKQERFSYTK